MNFRTERKYLHTYININICKHTIDTAQYELRACERYLNTNRGTTPVNAHVFTHSYIVIQEPHQISMPRGPVLRSRSAEASEPSAELRACPRASRRRMVERVMVPIWTGNGSGTERPRLPQIRLSRTGKHRIDGKHGGWRWLVGYWGLLGDCWSRLEDVRVGWGKLREAGGGWGRLGRLGKTDGDWGRLE